LSIIGVILVVGMAVVIILVTRDSNDGPKKESSPSDDGTEKN
jgi:hypothetical protein